MNKTGNTASEYKTVLASAEKNSFSDKAKEIFAGKSKNSDDLVSVPQGAPASADTKEQEKKPLYEGQQTEKLYNIKDLTSDLTPKKILKIVGLVIMLVAIIAALYVRFFGIRPQNTGPTITKVPTPTFFDYTNYKPSVYADDSNFKKIDEGLNVLEREAVSTPLEEETLLPPPLDFDIVFK